MNQKITVNAIKKVIAKIITKAIRKITSATLSKRKLKLSFKVRIDRNEIKLQDINKIDAIPVHSSINVTSLNFDIFSEVKTIRQNPNKLDDVFRIWDDLLFVINFNLQKSERR